MPKSNEAVDPREASRMAIAAAQTALDGALTKEALAAAIRTASAANAAMRIAKLTKALNKAQFQAEMYEAMGNPERMQQVRTKFEGLL